MRMTLRRIPKTAPPTPKVEITPEPVIDTLAMAARTMGGARSERKTATSRENGKKGGRPKTVTPKWKIDCREFLYLNDARLYRKDLLRGKPSDFVVNIYKREERIPGNSRDVMWVPYE